MSIYFIRLGDAVKIGFSTDVTARVNTQLKAMPSGAACLGHMPGGADVEAHLHKVFGRFHQRGEWFDADPELISFAELMLIPDLPRKSDEALVAWHESPKPTLWGEYSALLRQAAWAYWPELNHKHRVLALRSALPTWKPRRIRCLYHAEAGGALRAHEVQDIDRLTAEAPALVGVAQGVPADMRAYGRRGEDVTRPNEPATK